MWSDDLQCQWTAWKVLGRGKLALELPEGNSCDMQGAIKAAQALCPDVFSVDVYSGRALEVNYYKAGSEWVARVPKLS